MNSKNWSGKKNSKKYNMRITLLGLLCLIILPITVVEGQNQLSNVFRKFRNDEGVNHLNLSGNITKILQGKDQKFVSKIEEMHVYIFSKNKNVSPSDKQKIDNALLEQKFELLINTKDKTSKIKIHGLEKDGFLTDLYMELLVNESNIYCILKGKILLSEMSKMNFDFEGSNVLNGIPLP